MSHGKVPKDSALAIFLFVRQKKMSPLWAIISLQPWTCTQDTWHDRMTSVRWNSDAATGTAKVRSYEYLKELYKLVRTDSNGENYLLQMVPIVSEKNNSECQPHLQFIWNGTSNWTDQSWEISWMNGDHMKSLTKGKAMSKSSQSSSTQVKLRTFFQRTAYLHFPTSRRTCTKCWDLQPLNKVTNPSFDIHRFLGLGNGHWLGVDG